MVRLNDGGDLKIFLWTCVSDENVNEGVAMETSWRCGVRGGLGMEMGGFEFGHPLLWG